MLPDKGWLVEARRVPSPHYDCRPDDENRPCWWCIILACPRRVWRSVDRCIIHRNDRSRRPSFFAEIAHLRVSAHCLIRRDGEIVQYVPLISVRGMRAYQTIRGGNVVMISPLVLSWRGRIRWLIPMRSISS